MKPFESCLPFKPLSYSANALKKESSFGNWTLNSKYNLLITISPLIYLNKSRLFLYLEIDHL